MTRPFIIDRAEVVFLLIGFVLIGFMVGAFAL
jgi:hypothetical protein